jgi:Protein of unknown function (DUF2934)
MESQDNVLDKDPVRQALRIEKLLNRAQEIHRSRGGLFGYDLEDWLEAERELAEKTDRMISEFEKRNTRERDATRQRTEPPGSG